MVDERESVQASSPPRRVRWGALARVVVMLVPVGTLLGVLGVTVFRSQPRDVGRDAPAFDMERLDGRGRVSSGQFAGRAYVLNFWASWCIPCREEAPVLAEVAGTGSDEPAFVGVNMLDGRAEAVAFVRKFGIRYANVRDTAGQYRTFGVTGIPETVFVDRRGRIAGRWIGAIDEPTLRKVLADLVLLRPGQVLRISGRGPSVGV